MKHHLPILSLMMLAATPLTALAYDMAVANADGSTIYYNDLGNSCVEVTYAAPYHPTAAYTRTLKIPSSVTSNGKSYKVTAIGDNAFYGCRALEGVEIPQSVTEIGMRAFAWCDAIASINIPGSVTVIGANAFDGCYALSEIIASGNADIATDGVALYSADMTKLLVYSPGVEGAFVLPEGTQAIAPGAFGGCTFLSEVKLPDGLATIGENAFYFCNGLRSIEIPASVTEIGKGALSDCFSLESIDVATGNTVYSSVDGTLLTADGTTVLQSPGAKMGLATIPNAAKAIAPQAFFRNCGITNVVIPSGITEISDAAFIDCLNLSTVEIPSTVKSIGSLAFAICPRLSAVYLHVKDPKSIKLGDDVFADIDFDACTLYVPAGAEGAYQDAPQWRQFGSIASLSDLKTQYIDWPETAESVSPSSSVQLLATATSDLPVYYLLSPGSQEIAEIVGDEMSVLAKGHITLTAFQPGNEEYMAAEPVTRTFTSSILSIDDFVADANAVKVYGGIGTIIIKGAAPEDVAQVYDTNGRLIYAGTDRTISVEPGAVYVVRIASRGYKVMAR